MGGDSQAEGVLHSHVLVVGRVGRGVVEREIHLHNTWLCQPPACAPALTADRDWDPGNTFCPNLFLCSACGITPQVMLQALLGAELRVLAGGLTSPWETVLDPVLGTLTLSQLCFRKCRGGWLYPLCPTKHPQAFLALQIQAGRMPFSLGEPQAVAPGSQWSQGWEEQELSNGMMGSSSHHPLPGYASSLLLPAPLPSITAPTSQGTFSSGTGKRRV